MNSAETVDRILKGSKNIDQMREEVWKIIQMLRGFVVRIDPRLERIKSGETFRYGNCEWTVESPTAGTPRMVKAAEKDIWIICWKNEGFGPRSLWGTTINSDRLASADAKFVREHLGVLVEGMMKVYPELQTVLQPLIEASDFYD